MEVRTLPCQKTFKLEIEKFSLAADRTGGNTQQFRGILAAALRLSSSPLVTYDLGRPSWPLNLHFKLSQKRDFLFPFSGTNLIKSARFLVRKLLRKSSSVKTVFSIKRKTFGGKLSEKQSEKTM